MKVVKIATVVTLILSFSALAVTDFASVSGAQAQVCGTGNSSCSPIGD